jgi:thioredoxin 1
MGDLTVELNEGTFESGIREGVTLVDFWAPWCAPCRMQGPILDRVAEQIKGKATVAKLNVDEAPGVAGNYRVQSIPTLLVFRDGKVVNQFVGVQSESVLVSAIESAGDGEGPKA